MTMENKITCPGCQSVYDITDVLRNAKYYWENVNIVVAENPCCQKREEVRIQTGKAIRGYVYAAGSPHFCGMVDYKVKGLTLNTKSPYSFTLNEQNYEIETK